MSTLEHVTTDEVADVIRLLPQKSSPLDVMPVSLLKLSADIMAPLIARLANLSFKDGVFPSRYKGARVTPLLKKPSLPPQDPANYRPISNLCTFSKILEKLFLFRLQPHVMKSANYCKFQSAYRKGYSTETALLRVVNDIQRAAGNGRCTALLALDISAAFDAVDHATLIDRALNVFGVHDVALDWLRSFVTERTQQIAVGSEKSAVFECSSGVPQGSVLGPLLFGMYVSPIGDVISQHNVEYHQYADDMQLYVSLSPADFGDLSTIESCASDVSRWFVENALLLNPTKTEAVIFGTSQRLSQVNRPQGVRVAGADVQFADYVKLLGVTLDSTLSFDKHVIEVTRSCHYHIRALRHIRPLLTLDTAKAMAVAIVGSRLDYCNSVLYGMSQANINRLQRVQNILARVVARAPWTVSSLDIRRDLHWLPVSHRINFKLCLLTWKTLHTARPPYLSELITHYLPPRALRSSNTNLLARPTGITSNFTSRAFSVSAPSTWNSLPTHIRSLDKLSTFKRQLKSHLFQSAFAA